MDTILLNALRQLGCNDKQIRMYRASMLGGALTLPELARVARIQRSTAYLIASELIEKGLLEEDHKSYRKQFVAVQPEVVLRKLEAKHRQLGRTNLAFKEHLPELQAAHQGAQTRPKVRTFEGITGLNAVQEDILRVKQEVLIWTNQQSERHIFHAPNHEGFIRERVRRGIPARVLVVDNAEGKLLIKNDAANLRETRLLSPGVNFTSETYIYGDKIAVLDFSKSIFGVITENKQIADSQRAVFELTWTQLGKRE